MSFIGNLILFFSYYNFVDFEIFLLKSQNNAYNGRLHYFSDA